MKSKKLKFTKDPRTWGYARVSTDEQEMRMQIEALEARGVDGIFMEKASGKNLDRPEFKKMMSELYTRPGDTVIVWKLDRLGRSITDLIEVVEEFREREVNFICIQDEINTSTATGRLFFHFMAAMAQWERDLIAERTKAGIQAAKAAGKKFGRKPLIWHNGHGSERRIAFLRHLNEIGELRERQGEHWILIPSAEKLMVQLNKAKNRSNSDKPIDNAETVRRWTRNGWQGLDLEEDLGDG